MSYSTAIVIVLALVFVVLPLSFLIAASILQFAARKAVKCYLPFGRACLITLVNILGNLPVQLISFGLNIVLVKSRQVPEVAITLPTLVMSFLVSSGIYGAMVKPKEWEMPIGFRKGMLLWLVVALIHLAIVLAFAVIIGFLLLGFNFLFPHH